MSWCRGECVRSNLYLQHEPPQDIVNCRWQRVGPRLFLAYRIAVALWFLIVLIISGVDKGSPKFLIYFTEWSLTTLTATLIIKAICVGLYLPWFNTGQSFIKLPQSVMRAAAQSSLTVSLMIVVLDTGDEFRMPLIKKPGTKYGRTPLMLQICWLLNTVITTAAIVVSIIYWSILAPNNTRNLLEYKNIHAHLLNSVIVIVEFVLTTAPFRLAHVYQPITFMLLYGGFTGIYWAAGGTAEPGKKEIYPILKWDEVEIIIPVLIGIFCGGTIIHMLVCVLAHYRDKPLKNHAKNSESGYVENALDNSDV